MSDVAPRFLFIDVSRAAKSRDRNELDNAFAEGELGTLYTIAATADNNLICTFDLAGMDSGETLLLRKSVETVVNDVWANWEGRKRLNYRGCCWLQ